MTSTSTAIYHHSHQRVAIFASRPHCISSTSWCISAWQMSSLFLRFLVHFLPGCPEMTWRRYSTPSQCQLAASLLTRRRRPNGQRPLLSSSWRHFSPVERAPPESTPVSGCCGRASWTLGRTTTSAGVYPKQSNKLRAYQPGAAACLWDNKRHELRSTSSSKFVE